MAKTGSEASDQSRKVILCTKYRGVFFGELVSYDRAQEIAVMRNVRNLLLWSESVRGVFGLAATGPNSECRVGPVFPGAELPGVSAVIECTPEAIKAWEAATW